MIKVSVIIPICNSEKYLGECLESVLNQSLTGIEILCVDDGSTDDSAAIVKRYQQQTDNIILFQQENKGAWAARNRGLNRAGGEFVFFLDSDDRIASPDTLEKLYCAAMRQGTDVAGGSLYREIDGRLCSDFSGTQKKYLFKEEGRILYRDYQYDLGFSRFLYKRTLLEEEGISFPPYKLFEDPVFMVRALQAAKIFAVIPDPVYIYRDTTGSITHVSSLDKLIDLTAAIQDNLDFALKNDLKELYKLTFIHLNRESRTELEYALNELDQDHRLFDALIRINGDIRWDLLPEGEDHLLLPLQMVYREYRQYEKLRRNPLVRLLKSMSVAFRKKQKK